MKRKQIGINMVFFGLPMVIIQPLFINQSNYPLVQTVLIIISGLCVIAGLVLIRAGTQAKD